jgi:hypothetical protein
MFLQASLWRRTFSCTGGAAEYVEHIHPDVSLQDIVRFA